MRLHETIEQRNFDLKAQNDDFKKKLSELERCKDSSEQNLQGFQRQVVDLRHQLDLQKAKHADELKHLEREFELRGKLLEHEIEKRIREEI